MHLSEIGELVPHGDVETAHPSALLGWPVVELASLGDEIAQPHQVGLVESEPRAVVEDENLLATRERSEEGRERNLAIVDVDDDAQVEPVAVALVRDDLDARRLGRFLVHRDVFGDADDDPRLRLEPRERFQGKGRLSRAGEDRLLACQPPPGRARVAELLDRRTDSHPGKQVEDVEAADEVGLRPGIAQPHADRIAGSDENTPADIVGDGHPHDEPARGSRGSPSDVDGHHRLGLQRR